eukprot:4319783-Lingulodinium_polyedra.AAC.1
MPVNISQYQPMPVSISQHQSVELERKKREAGPARGRRQGCGRGLPAPAFPPPSCPAHAPLMLNIYI